MVLRVHKGLKALLAHKDQLALQVRMELMGQLVHKALRVLPAHKDQQALQV
jgi:hypothetical protein